MNFMGYSAIYIDVFYYYIINHDSPLKSVSCDYFYRCVFETPFSHVFPSSHNPPLQTSFLPLHLFLHHYRNHRGVVGEGWMNLWSLIAPNLSLTPWVPLCNTSWPMPINDSHSNPCSSSRTWPSFSSSLWTPINPLSRTLIHCPWTVLTLPNN